MSNFFSNLLSAIVGAGILAAVPVVWALFGGSSILISYNWMNVPAPSYIASGSDAGRQSAILPFLSESDAQKFYQAFRSSEEFRITTVEVANNSDERSKDVEININKPVLAFLSGPGDAAGKYRSIPIDNQGSVKIGALNPGSKSNLLFVSNEYSFRDQSILALSDGKKLPTVSNRIADDIFGITGFANRHPLLAYVYVCVSVLIILPLVALIPFAIAAYRNIDFAAKHTNTKELLRWQKVIDRAKQIDPTKALALGALTQTQPPTSTKP